MYQQEKQLLRVSTIAAQKKIVITGTDFNVGTLKLEKVQPLLAKVVNGNAVYISF